MKQYRVSVGFLFCFVLAITAIAFVYMSRAPLPSVAQAATRQVAFDAVAAPGPSNPADPESVFLWITNATVGGGPKWDSWCTKQDVGIENLPGFKIDREKPTDAICLGDADFRAITTFYSVAQAVPDLAAALNNAVALTSASPSPASATSTGSTRQVAPVLFNPIAAQYIRGLVKLNSNLDFASSMKIKFPQGSVIVKTVWEIQQWQTPQNSIGPMWIISSSAMDEMTNNVSPVNPPPPATFNIDTSQEACPLNALSAMSPVPIGCLHSHDIPVKSSDHILRQNASYLDNCGGNGCTAILVGFLVMIMPDNTGNWEWMTFWLTPDGQPQGRMPIGTDKNGLVWQQQALKPHHGLTSGPWQFFVENSTSIARQPMPGQSGMYSICFNPYIEAQRNPKTGPVSNCLGCHQYAGYYKGPPQYATNTERGQGTNVGLCVGERPLIESLTAEEATKLNAQITAQNQFFKYGNVWSLSSRYNVLGEPESGDSFQRINPNTCQIDNE